MIGGTATIPTLHASNVSADDVSVGVLDVSGGVVIGGTATILTLSASTASHDNIWVVAVHVSGAHTYR